MSAIEQGHCEAQEICPEGMASESCFEIYGLGIPRPFKSLHLKMPKTSSDGIFPEACVGVDGHRGALAKLCQGRLVLVTFWYVDPLLPQAM